MTTNNAIAYLSVRDAPLAIEYYIAAFGAEEVAPRLTDPAGKVLHTELRLGDANFMLAEEFPQFENHSPLSLGGTTVRIHLRVEDVDAVAKKAVELGGVMKMEVADQFYGERSGRLQDPFGHQWILSTPIEEVSPEEMVKRCNELFENGGDPPDQAE